MTSKHDAHPHAKPPLTGADIQGEGGAGPEKTVPPRGRARESAGSSIEALARAFVEDVTRTAADPEGWSSSKDAEGIAQWDTFTALQSALDAPPAPPEPFRIATGDPEFDPDASVKINGFLFEPATRTEYVAIRATGLDTDAPEVEVTPIEDPFAKRVERPTMTLCINGVCYRSDSPRFEGKLGGQRVVVEYSGEADVLVNITTPDSPKSQPVKPDEAGPVIGVERVFVDDVDVTARCFMGAPLLGKVGEGDRPRRDSGDHDDPRHDFCEPVRDRLKTDGEWHLRDVAAYLRTGEFHAMIEHPESKRAWADRIDETCQLIDDCFVTLRRLQESGIGTYTEAQREAVAAIIWAALQMAEKGRNMTYARDARDVAAAVANALGLERASCAHRFEEDQEGIKVCTHCGVEGALP